MSKIIKLSHVFKRIFQIIFLGWPVALALIWFPNQSGFLATHVGLGVDNFLPNNLFAAILVPLDWTLKLEGFVVSFIPMIMGMWLAALFVRLFSFYEQGQIFTHRSINMIKKIALVLILSVVANFIYQALISLVMTLDNPPGQHLVMLSMGTSQIRNLITAGLIFLIAHIMQEGLKLKEEQALTV